MEYAVVCQRRIADEDGRSNRLDAAIRLVEASAGQPFDGRSAESITRLSAGGGLRLEFAPELLLHRREHGRQIGNTGGSPPV